MDQVFRISPFIYSDPSDTQFQDFIPDICRSTCMLVDSEPSEARHKIQMALERGYDINTTLDGQTCLHYLMAKRYTLWLNHIPSYLDLLVFVIQNGADVYAVDVG